MKMKGNNECGTVDSISVLSNMSNIPLSDKTSDCPKASGLYESESSYLLAMMHRENHPYSFLTIQTFNLFANRKNFK